MRESQGCSPARIEPVHGSGWALRAAHPADIESIAELKAMWWTFVGRTHEDVVEARADRAGRRFGTVPGGETPLPAPELATVWLKASDRHGQTSG